jgi:hypothetical protein
MDRQLYLYIIPLDNNDFGEYRINNIFLDFLIEYIEILSYENFKLSLELFEKLERKNIKFECPICLDFKEEAVSLPCNHDFCEKCAKEWLVNNKDTCPTCRTKVTNENNN